MFNKKKSKKQFENYIDIKNLPILILDEDWLNYFKKDDKNNDIIETEEELRQLIKEQGKINDQTKQLSASKKNVLSQILTQSNDVVEKGTSSAKAKLEKSKNKVSEINNTLNDLEQQSDLLPDKIEEVNNKLFQLSVKQAYNKIGKHMKELKKYEANIDKLRAQLAEETAKKEKLEETLKSSMDFLADYIGDEGIRQLNKKYNGSI